MKTQLYWTLKQTPAELRPMLREFGKFYPLRQDPPGDVALHFEKVNDGGSCEIRLSGKSAKVRYSTGARAARAVGTILSGLVSEGRSYCETTPFESLGIMLDCSRNAVMKVDHLKRWLRQLALLGYNRVMLYTEDTYEVPGEPYFGYQRGAYSAVELKAIDQYAAKLGIEMVPCIQTLGHLEKVLRHKSYATVRDTASVMMVGERETYALIEKMVSQWRQVSRATRIHVGMDETHDLGRGAYMDKHGYRSGFDLFNEHLAMVADICGKYGFKPMIWSDMYFRLGSKTRNYYDPESVIPDAVAEKIPMTVELVYWDYYHSGRAFYRDWIERHRRLGKEPLMASGIWTWNKYWHDHGTTVKKAGACIDACYECNLKDLFFTMWGDNGAYCDHDSAFAGIVFCAEKAYGNAVPEPSVLEKRFGAVCGGSYAAHVLAADIHGCFDLRSPNMWDDPIFETDFRTWAKDDPDRMNEAAAGFAALARRLRRHANSLETGNLNYAYTTARAFASRYRLAAALLRAYRQRNREGIRAARRRIGNVVKGVRAMEDAFRGMWMSHNKPEGMETIQARFGMVQARYRELERRIAEYLRGETANIAELDYRCPPE